MWPGLDPNIRRELASIREMVALRHQTPTKEWPLIYVQEYDALLQEHDALLVVREWPDGSVTAYHEENRT